MPYPKPMLLLLLLTLCYVSFCVGMKKLTYKKEECRACCDGLPRYAQEKCNLSCIKKFSRHVLYDAKERCIQGCNLIVKDCRHGCIEACKQMFKHRKPNEKPSQKRSKTSEPELDLSLRL